MMVDTEGWGEDRVGMQVEGPYDVPFASKGLGLIERFALRLNSPQEGCVTVVQIPDKKLPKIAERFEKAAAEEYDNGLILNSQIYELNASRIRGCIAIRAAQKA